MSKLFFKQLGFIALLIFSIVFLSSCEVTNSPTYGEDNPDPFPSGANPPEVTSVVPDRGFAGDEITIYGSGFLPEAHQNLVNIGKATARIVDHSDSHITVIVPENDNGDQRLRVSIWGSEFWSNQEIFRYLDDYVQFDFGIPNPVGLAVDEIGNLYIGSSNTNEIYMIDAVDSVQTTFASVNVRGGMKFVPNGDLYVTASEGIVKVSPDGTTSVVVDQAGVLDFDFDSNGNIYMVLNTRLRRFDGTNNEEIATVTRAQRVRVFENYIYVTELTRSRVARFEITNTGVGEIEPYFVTNTPLTSLEIDESGNVYASAYVRDYIIKAMPGREGDGDITEIPNEDDRANPFRRLDTRLGTTYINNSVIYVSQDVGNGQVGKIWRLFIGERNAPRFGPSN
ncbi:MAG: IPT/TIG domain-containing protein [Balneolales bacterium]|nr:IPT/TIG domain-containing protein [Balneolales bacterium]